METNAFSPCRRDFSPDAFLPDRVETSTPQPHPPEQTDPMETNPSSPIRRSACGVCLAAALLASPLQAMSAASTDTQGQGATLHAEFAYDPAQRRLRVDYRVRNTGDAPLAVFDRGDRHAVASGRQRAGAVGAPAWKDVGDGAIELSHLAQPLPRPAPVSPPTPLALKLAPGAQAAGSFEFALPGELEPKRIRWCLGVAAFELDQLDMPQRYGEVEVWRASFALAQTQQRLCTPWFDPVRSRFAS
ncbi:hypothetical protein SAMN05421681_11266 [Lysobacter enzymogenes]|nr:hypothetical protein SAMN05421681_11266 [Lysobacter enzymogenes]